MTLAKSYTHEKYKNDRLLSFNPNSGEKLGEVAICNADEVRAAVRQARAAQRNWAAQSLAARIQIMRQVQETLVDHAQEIAGLVSREMGKIETDSLIGDVLLVLTCLDGYLKLAPRALGARRLSQGLLHSTKRSTIIREPLGVVGVISPFNYPVFLSMQSIFAALIAGNGVVHKPSEYTPLTALSLQEVFYEAGLPPSLLQTVHGGAATGKALLNSGIDHISFAGSSQVGRKVAAAAGENLIPATLELGGNNAMLVCEDALLPRAVDCALAYAFVASGQVCGAVRRVYVQQAVVEEFVERLQEQLAAWKVSTDTQPGGADVTALVNEEALALVERRVAEAVDAGARVLCGGRRLTNTSAPLFEPTILVDTTPEMQIMQMETFGPVVSVTAVTNDDEAITLANSTPYGLTASVWTNDDDRAWRIARQLQVATVAINDHLWPFFAPEVPWGGIKASGLGRVGGIEGLQSMTYQKVISYDRLKLPREIYWFPRPKWLHFALLMAIPLLYSRQWGKRLRALGNLISGLARKQWR